MTPCLWESGSGRRWPAAATSSRRRCASHTVRDVRFEAASTSSVPCSRRIKPEALDRRHAAIFKDGPLPPGFAAVGGEQQKRIARRALQIGAGDPAILEIDELDLIEVRRREYAACGSLQVWPASSVASRMDEMV